MAREDFKDLKLEEQLLIKYSVIKHLILLKIQNIIDIDEVLLQCFINILIKKAFGEAIKELPKELHKQLLENLEKEKCIHIL